jgi:glycosyltransferase involved in cell wall biosynthesis
MKVIVAARSLNEEHNVKDFCENHSFADRIIIADGGSTDNTVEIAETFDNVEVIYFDWKMKFDDGSFMNPEGPHFDFTYRAAKSYDPDWIIWQGMDHRINSALRRDIFKLLDECTHEIFYARMIYVWKGDQYFHGLSYAGGYYPLAFHRRCEVRANNDVGPCNLERIIPKRPKDVFVDNPYCVLHHSWPNEKIIQEKLRRYEKWGRPMKYPTESKSFGKLMPIEDWMIV